MEHIPCCERRGLRYTGLAVHTGPGTVLAGYPSLHIPVRARIPVPSPDEHALPEYETTRNMPDSAVLTLNQWF